MALEIIPQVAPNEIFLSLMNYYSFAGAGSLWFYLLGAPIGEENIPNPEVVDFNFFSSSAECFFLQGTNDNFSFGRWE